MPTTHSKIIVYVPMTHADIVREAIYKLEN